MYTILLVVHTIIVVFLILMVLLQRTDSDGMGGLSGGGGNQFLTGRSQANLMTRTTAILAGLFMLTSLILAVMASRMTETSIVDGIAVPKVEDGADKAAVKKDEKAAAPAKADKAAKEPVKEEKAKEAPKAAAPSVPKPE